MLNFNVPCGFRPFRTVLCITLLLACALRLPAQDVPATVPQNEQVETERIVDGRPTLYSVKHAVNPLTWIEAGARPIFRSAEAGVRKLSTRHPDADKTSGVKFGLDGAGPGSGFGPEVTLFHNNLLGRRIESEARLLFTYSRYQVYQLTARVPLVSEGSVDRLSLDVGTGYRSRNAVNFYGIGNDSRAVDGTSFRSVDREASIGFIAQIDEAWKSGFHVAYRNIGVTEPSKNSSAQEIFSGADVPGLLSGAKLRSMVLSMDRDTRDNQHLPTTGGIDHVQVGLNEGIGKGDFSYWKYRFDFQRFFALDGDGSKVVTVRGMAETNQEKGGSRVPFFDMPVVGNSDTIRGFQNYRFYDKSAMSLGLEYRYRIWRALDWALFLDEAQVAPEPGDFGLDRFHTGYGVGFIMLPKRDWPIRVDVGHSNESWRLYISFDSLF